jgi:hypothetical protein
LRIIEAVGGSKFYSNRPLAEAVRFLVHATAFAVPYAMTQRPLTSLGLAALLVSVLSIANTVKKRVVFEPIVFSDLGLLGQIVRHPKLYFMDRPLEIFTGVLLVSGALITAIWFEPQLLPWAPAYVFVGGAWLALFTARSVIRAQLAPMLLDERTGWGSTSFGLLTAIVLQFVSWLGSKQARSSDTLSMPEVLPACDIVLVQLESFIDLSATPSIQSAEWAKLTSRSKLYGKLIVEARGANTMRTEHSVLSGVPNSALGFDRFDPYLRRLSAKYGVVEALRTLGWDTVFVHPNDLRFFRRDRALPLLGFSKLVGTEAFLPDQLVGPYVGDRAVASRIIDELKASDRPKFVFAVTMENHGPWKPGRLPGVEPGLPSYLAHQRNMYEALEELLSFAARSERRTIIILYGDHAPALADLPPHLEPYQTDFLIFDNQYCGQPRRSEPMLPERLLHAAINSLREASTI